MDEQEEVFKSYAEKFLTEGMVAIPNFLSDDDVEQMKKEYDTMVKEIDASERPTIFTTKGDQARNEYFLNSGDKIRYFYEEDAFDSKGNLVVSKDRCLNKIGHALHWLNPVFRKVSFSNKVKALVKAIGFKDPVIVQSMYICKNAGIGSEVLPHQDATYLFTEPSKLIGLWFALEDATLENGCLWYIPKSHVNVKVLRRFVRNPAASGPLVKFEGPDDDYSDKGTFVPVPVRKGSCIVIHGNVVHKSERNVSPFPRPAYTYHIVDRHDSVYSPQNWLQPTEDLPFPSLYNNS